MTDFYQELGIDRAMSIDGIAKVLNQLESTWVRREATNPEKAVKMRALIVEARSAFATSAAKAKYDRDLADSRRKPKEETHRDSRETMHKHWYDQALAYFNKGEYDLAKTAIERALSFVNPSLCNDAFYSLTSDIYYKNGDYQTALSYINKAIVDNPAPMHYILKAGIYRSMEKVPRYPGTNYSAEWSKALNSAISLAEGNGRLTEAGNAYGLYAIWLYETGGTPNITRAEELASKAVGLGDSWGNANKVLKSIEAERVRKLEAERKAQEQAKLIARNQELARQEEERKKEAERLKKQKELTRSAVFRAVIPIALTLISTWCLHDDIGLYLILAIGFLLGAIFGFGFFMENGNMYYLITGFFAVLLPVFKGQFIIYIVSAIAFICKMIERNRQE